MPNVIYPNAERIVVDEVFEGGVARILRSKRLTGFAESDFGIESWGTEREWFIEQWKVEAFVGFLAPRKLQEGDVFFIKNGKDLDRYKEIEPDTKRKYAAEKFLIKTPSKSIDLSRNEIKAESCKLGVIHISGKEKDQIKLNKIIEEKLKEDKNRK